MYIMKSSNIVKSAFYNRTLLKVVVGASKEKNKFGNKVLRCYIDHSYSVIPIHKKDKVIENLQTVESLTFLNHLLFSNKENDHRNDVLSKLKAISGKEQISLEQIGVSIITPPVVTRQVLEEGFRLGFKYFYLQPGTFDDTVDTFVSTIMKDASVIKGCVLVDHDFEH